MQRIDGRGFYSLAPRLAMLPSVGILNGGMSPIRCLNYPLSLRETFFHRWPRIVAEFGLQNSYTAVRSAGAPARALQRVASGLSLTSDPTVLSPERQPK